MISMFIMISTFAGQRSPTVHDRIFLTQFSSGINLHRAIQAYGVAAPTGKAFDYYHDLSRWDNFSFGVIVNILTWHADALMVSSISTSPTRMADDECHRFIDVSSSGDTTTGWLLSLRCSWY